MDLESIDHAYRDFLRHRYGFGDWPASRRPTLILGLRPEVLDLAPLRLVRAEQLAVSDARAAFQSLWASDQNPEILIRIDLFEMASSSSARDITLTLLGEFQGPELLRTQQPVGDVSFANPGFTALVFAHQNVAAMARNAGRQVVSVDQVGRQLDQALLKIETPSRGQV